MGNISEGALRDSLVLDADGNPLVIQAVDVDSNNNARLRYEILDQDVLTYFSIDPHTGAIHCVASLDYETQSHFNFTVQVSDSGKPPRKAHRAASVSVQILDVNDNAPTFSQNRYNATVVLPTYSDVRVIRLEASDPDTVFDKPLSFSIIRGNEEGVFGIDSSSAVVRVEKNEIAETRYQLQVEASDGKYVSTAWLHVSVQREAESGFVFTQERYTATVSEHSATEIQLVVLVPVGLAKGEHLRYTLLNNQDWFTVGQTSGVLSSLGVQFDREQQENYTVVVKVEDTHTSSKSAHVVVHVTVTDINDNAPMFINLPYHCTVSGDAKEGEVIHMVKAIDADVGENGSIRYSLAKTSSDKFAINAYTREIVVKGLDQRDHNTEIILKVIAQDKGSPPLTAVAAVHVHVIDSSSPLFESPIYMTSVPENVAPHTPVKAVKAISPHGQKLIYSISRGDKYGEFSLDFNTDMENFGPCYISVVGKLNYEDTKSYQLTVRASDVFTGNFAEALVNITVEDVNDNSPVFTNQTYTKTLSESVVVGTEVLKVTATDVDQGANSLVHYDLAPLVPDSPDPESFLIHPETGLITLRRPLDHESQTEYHFLAVATDSGSTALSSTSLVVVKVLDLNDNPPVFTQPSYNCHINDDAGKSQLVFKVVALDPDESDANKLLYSIVGGNSHLTFTMEEQTGIISLSHHRQPVLSAAYTLNVSVTDGVYSNFARVTVAVHNVNRHRPVFNQEVYDVVVSEDVVTGSVVATVAAGDEDRGNFGTITYSIMHDGLMEMFAIDADTGEITLKKTFDREQESKYTLPVAVTDNGGKMGFATVTLHVTDVNDNAPQFEMSEYKVNIPLSSPINASVVQIKATDEDEGINGKIVYTLQSGNDADIARLFDLNTYTGEITLKESLQQSENQLFQFFVRATDKGEKPQESHVPVEILVMGQSDTPPVFEPSRKFFFVDEDQRIGSVITTVIANSSVPVSYEIVSGFSPSTNRPPSFTINQDGQLRLARKLKWDKTNFYTLHIRARTVTSPSLVAHKQIEIKVGDVNDNYPVFSCSPYRVSLSEDTGPQHSLVQLMATDVDQHSEPVEFSLAAGMQKMSSLFSVDPYTGWITLLSSVDRERQSQYNISVQVIDHPANLLHKSYPALTSTTSVIVTVTDVNDNAPIFKKPHYHTAVNEQALPGTVIVKLQTSDLDTTDNARVTFYIIHGDTLGKFEVHSTGELFVNKALDRETQAQYSLQVAASDGTFVTVSTVTVDILDENDNAPVCDQPVHTVVENEDILMRTAIAHVRATDADDQSTINSRIFYSLSGEGAENFQIDRETGLVSTAKLLDRETQAEYFLTATATDGGGLSCEVTVHISLKDVNDNAPAFTQGTLRETYSIHEDAKIHTLLTRLVAIDADTGINSQIHYRLDSPGKTFSINSHSGIISLNQPLDRETSPAYNLTVVAYNPILPELSSEATIKVMVLDVNDNPPEFEHSSYSTSVEESASIGTPVKRVKATSLDIGVNADITYTIAAGNEQGKFAIDPIKGIVTVEELLDHETTREYLLTILATDQGEPPLSNTAVLAINVTDVNDNAPKFSQSAYTVHVKEDMLPDTEVFKVMATDRDSPGNAAITYSIIDGNINNNFMIDPRTGVLRVNTHLDREETESYSLLLEAHDSGRPRLVSSAVVSIQVSDVNDCPPRFLQDSYRGMVQEGRRTGIEVVTVNVVDDDLPENGAPFIFEIVEGNSNGEFHIDSGGVINTAGKLSKKAKDLYHLTVRAHDRGKPPLHSDVTVIVEVVDDSVFPPEVRNLDISIRSCMDSFQRGVIGQVEAHDRDPYDKSIFSIVSPNSHLFDVHRFDGRLIALTGLDAGSYTVNVSVSDGKFTSFGKVDIQVVCTSKEMLDNAVTIRFEHMIEEQFYANFKDDFQRVIKQGLDVRMADVEIINVQPSSESVNLSDEVRTKREINNRHIREAVYDLDVLFAVRKSADRFFGKRSLKRKVDKIRGRIESVLGVHVLSLFTDTCTKSACDIGTCVGKVEFDESTLVPVLVNGASYVSARHRYTQQCVCLEGNCEEQVCGDTTCTANKICQRDAFGDYSCQCPDGRMGDLCETLVPLCSGSTCPIERPLTFAGKSYAKWVLQHSTKKRYTLKLRIRTRQSSATLMYAKGKVDYSILKIERGNLVYKFDCGSGEGLVHIPVALSDGQWHTIQLDRNGREAELSLDGVYTALGAAPGIHAILNVDTEEVYFGAEVDIFPNGFRDINHGFEGCMEDIRIFNIPLPFSGSNEVAKALEFEMVEFHCQDYPAKYLPGGNACSNNPCLNGGQCKFSGLNSYVCICRGRYRGPNCERDPDPCSDQPCQNGGRCEVDHEVPNSYKCRCKDQLTGVHCSYGKLCRPNPCHQGGVCVEGPTAALCDCKSGYSGLYCDRMADVCDSLPCLNGGTCLHAVDGSFSCNCTTDYHGNHCQLVVFMPGAAMTSTDSTMLWGIVAAVGVIVLMTLVIVLVLLLLRRRRRSRGSRRCIADVDGGSQMLLNSKGKRVSNPDLSEAVPALPSQPPPVPMRPASYTPSTNDSLPTLNNLDGIRNYGSAGDDLDSNPGSGRSRGGHLPSFPQYLESYSNPSYNKHLHPMLRAPTPPQATPQQSRKASESDSIQKAPWEFEYPNILENYMEGDKKQHDKLAKRMPGVHSPQPSPHQGRQGRLATTVADTSSISSLPVSESEDDLNAKQGQKKGYHWDTSDWAPGPSMPNISEIPTHEILDSPSSSQPSDDCNTHACGYDDNLTTHATYPATYPASRDDSPLLSEDQQRQNNISTNFDTDDPNEENVISNLDLDDDDEQDYFEDSEYVGDSEYAENEPDELPPSYADHPKYEQLLQDFNDTYKLPNNLNVHPDHYLPDYFSGQDLDLTDDNGSGDKSPVGARRSDGDYLVLCPPKEFMTPGYSTEAGPPSRMSFIDDMSMSVGLTSNNASCSDISGLCEIEDSEINCSDTDDENTPLKSGQLQTSV